MASSKVIFNLTHLPGDIYRIVLIIAQEIQHASRPLSQHRLSMGTTSGSIPRQSHTRIHSHSVSSGSLIPNHRVTRRKSVSSNSASNVAAMVAAVREAGDTTLGMPITNRRNTVSKNASSRGALGSSPSPPASLPGNRMRTISTEKLERGDSAIDDDMDDEEQTDFKQSRLRRASEGQHLMKDGKKVNGGDLKCDKCGKGYKHSSCLTKHLFVPTCLFACSMCNPRWMFFGRPTINFLIADGSIHLNGHSLQSCLSLSINRSSCWKQLLSY